MAYQKPKIFKIHWKLMEIGSFSFPNENKRCFNLKQKDHCIRLNNASKLDSDWRDELQKKGS
jgi:hypothetical protein